MRRVIDVLVTARGMPQLDLGSSSSIAARSLPPAANDTLEEIEDFTRARVPAFCEAALREAARLENLNDLNWVDDVIGSY